MTQEQWQKKRINRRCWSCRYATVGTEFVFCCAKMAVKNVYVPRWFCRCYVHRYEETGNIQKGDDTND